jgi:FMN-dependent oxidoreductase (nitrilotriacetate monooxygenase family)
MPTPKRQMALTAFLFPPGSHTAGWRAPDARGDADMDIQSYIDAAQTAERGKFDMVFVQDSAAVLQSAAMARGEKVTGTNSRAVRLEPLTLMSAVAAVTSRIGLVATSTTTYNEPYEIARKFLTLDHVSGGRAGWNLVTSQTEDEAGNFGLDEHVYHALRYERAMEFQEVVVGLWDSFEDDALIRDKASGRYFDVEKVHLLNHKGKHFSVRGPLNIVRSPQGRPVIAQAGSSEPGMELAARTADVVFTAQTTIEDAVEFYTDVKGRMAKYGRHPDEMKVMPGLNFMVAETQAEADELYEQMASVVPQDVMMQSLNRLAGGVDLRQYPLDGPLPELPPSNAARARQQMLINFSQKRKMTIRQLAKFFSMGNGHNVVYGTPTHIADVMEEYFVRGGADGFTMMPPYESKPLERFVDLVIPELQRRGLFRTEYEGRTLREHLGLPFPENSLAKRRRMGGVAAE